jgi:AraC family transcriptional regulator
VDRIRDEEAARLLRDSDLSITETGYVCGFADSAHFSLSFKKRHGASPSAYRCHP